VGKRDIRSGSIWKRKRRGDGTPTKGMGEDKATLWSKRTVYKGSGHEYGRVDNKIGGSNPGRVQRMQLQENKDSGEQGAEFPGENTAE